MKSIRDMITIIENLEKGNENWAVDMSEKVAPKLRKELQKIMSRSFKEVYPDVEFKAWVDEEAVFGSTLKSDWVSGAVWPETTKDPEKVTDWSAEIFVDFTELNIDPNKTVNAVSLLVSQAASGPYRGVWRTILKYWAEFLKKNNNFGAEIAAFEIDQDQSGGQWKVLADKNGLYYHRHEHEK
jgi:hypothetical protein